MFICKGIVFLIKGTFLKNLEDGKSRKYSLRGKLLRRRLNGGESTSPTEPGVNSIKLLQCNLQV